ncbi:hypothetical protein [Saccharothrix luteola]|uniref:hypothetical protein n=1 Tax=Saccharothrix luteola TaxID=2893018 RepID=UPI001E366976|nr:hypothetical protein [Saccharothrix luteola]MCC8247642.1 hypothetical protein [Saccharothrix luteola]
MSGTHRPDHGHNPPLDMAAIRARLAARSPEESAARKAGLDALRLGEDAMVLGEQHLADGDLQRAREFFAMAARYRAADAEAMLRTVDALLEATRDPEITATVTGTALDGGHTDSRAERDLTAHRAWETAELLRGIEDHAVQAAAAHRRTQAVLALALTAAAETLSTAQAKADAIVAAAGSRASHAVDAGQDSHDLWRSRLILPGLNALPEPLSAIQEQGARARARLSRIIEVSNELADMRLRSPWTGLRGTYAHRMLFAAVTDADRNLDLVSYGNMLPVRLGHHVVDDHWRLVLSCPTDRRRSREDVLAEVRAALVRCLGNPDAEEVDRSELRLEWELAH